MVDTQTNRVYQCFTTNSNEVWHGLIPFLPEPAGPHHHRILPATPFNRRHSHA